ncbi:MAG: hypothetical protein RML46_01090 [Anaerolineae bacterium]|nr:hypothetical protein [Anaerolineae bacterium]MDW8067489.1 hypothetical protein [Anaerolineae bacterium]
MVSGFLGSGAPLASDLTLLSLWVLGGGAIGGWTMARRKAFPRHCRWMALVTWMAVLPILFGMVGPWLKLARLGPDVFAQPTTVVPFMHGLSGGIAQFLMMYTVVRMNWRQQWPPRRPLVLMRVSLALWLLSIAGGTGVYLLLYG